MNATRFDNLVSSSGKTSSRRTTLRLFGAAVAGLAAAAGIGVAGERGDALAKKDNDKGKNDKRCRAGRLIKTVAVYPTGPGMPTPVFKRGRRYRLRAVGYWTTNLAHSQDAVAAFPNNNHNAPEREYQGVRLGLSLDGGSPDEWGPYTPTHVYERMLIGEGVGLFLRNTDPVTADNSGTLFVEVYECD